MNCIIIKHKYNETVYSDVLTVFIVTVNTVIKTAIEITKDTDE